MRPFALLIQNGIVSGYVEDVEVIALQGAKVSISGNSYSDTTETDNKGYYEFKNLSPGDYTITYEEDGYKTQTKDVSLGEGELKDLGTVILEEEGDETFGKIYGYVVDVKGNPVMAVKLKLKGLRTEVKATETSDKDGFFEYAGLGRDTYVIIAKKKHYKRAKKTVKLKKDEHEEIKIKMRKTSKLINGLIR